nr:MAG TPA: hypothetical protein [Caudoviricetes sp.]
MYNLTYLTKTRENHPSQQVRLSQHKHNTKPERSQLNLTHSLHTNLLTFSLTHVIIFA